MKILYRTILPGNTTLHTKDLAIVSGTMFWIRMHSLPIRGLYNARVAISRGMTQGYRANGGVEHVLERLFPTIVKARGHIIKELPPAPKVVPLYFPQFHQFEENDRFWGNGFTEWTLLKRMEDRSILKPLAVHDGGFGYYDLLDWHGRTRALQGELASAAGVHAFCFYHYWFSGSHAPDHHKVMYKVTEAMAVQHKPNMKFMLSWANEPW
jgi:lipopolysaccharide biosynthesis protein